MKTLTLQNKVRADESCLPLCTHISHLFQQRVFLQVSLKTPLLYYPNLTPDDILEKDFIL